jgi:hypothetical protein
MTLHQLGTDGDATLLQGHPLSLRVACFIIKTAKIHRKALRNT